MPSSSSVKPTTVADSRPLFVSSAYNGDGRVIVYLNEWPKLAERKRIADVWDWVASDLGAFGQFQCVFDIHT